MSKKTNKTQFQIRSEIFAIYWNDVSPWNFQKVVKWPKIAKNYKNKTSLRIPNFSQDCTEFKIQSPSRHLQVWTEKLHFHFPSENHNISNSFWKLARKMQIGFLHRKLWLYAKSFQRKPFCGHFTIFTPGFLWNIDKI